MYPASVDADGNVRELSSSEMQQRTNCSTWHQAVYCPNGQIATAVSAFHTDEEITGVGLRCRRVVMRN